MEVEQSIQNRLAKFPVPDSIWEEYHLDQEINDRGVALDMNLVQQAIDMDTRSRKELTDAMKDLTSLENPNSVIQMKQWLADHGLEIDSLGKKEVAEVLRDAPPKLKKVLLLRQQFAKSSVRKYQAMQKASALMAVPVGCFSSLEPIGLVAGLAASSRCRISRKTISRIWDRPVVWSAPVTSMPWRCSTRMFRTRSRS